MKIGDKVNVKLKTEIAQIESTNKGPYFLVKASEYSSFSNFWIYAEDIIDQEVEHRADVSELILRQIIDALPVQRDWLDPTLERAARYILRRAEKNKDGDNEDAT